MNLIYIRTESVAQTFDHLLYKQTCQSLIVALCGIGVDGQLQKLKIGSVLLLSPSNVLSSAVNKTHLRYSARGSLHRNLLELQPRLGDEFRVHTGLKLPRFGRPRSGETARRGSRRRPIRRNVPHAQLRTQHGTRQSLHGAQLSESSQTQRVRRTLRTQLAAASPPSEAIAESVSRKSVPVRRA